MRENWILKQWRRLQKNMNKAIKNSWNSFSDTFGRTIIHPQYIKKNLEYRSIMEIKKHTGEQLIDIGCGRMPYRSELEPVFEKYVGVDHPEISKLYQSKIKPDVLADAHKLP